MAIDDIVKAGDWQRPCRGCGRFLPEGQFHACAVRKGRAYRKSSCIDCCRSTTAAHTRDNPDMAKARQGRRPNRDWTGERKKRLGPSLKKENRRRNVRAKFGITLEEYEGMLQDQGFQCAICSHDISLNPEGGERQAVLDHNHSSGDLRAFLCNLCNVLVGMCGENTNTLTEAILYLEKHNGH